MPPPTPPGVPENVDPGTLEPLPVDTASAMLGWDDAQRARVLELTALVFPVREGAIHVLHKTVRGARALAGTLDALTARAGL